MILFSSSKTDPEASFEELTAGTFDDNEEEEEEEYDDDEVSLWPEPFSVALGQ